MSESSDHTINRELRVKSTLDLRSSDRRSIITSKTTADTTSNLLSGILSEKPSGSPVIEGRDLTILQIIDVESELLCSKFSPDENIIALGFCDGTIQIFDITGQMICIIRDGDIASNACVLCMQFIPNSIKPNNILMASYATGHIKFWDISSQKCLSTICEMRQTTVIAPNADFSKLAASGSDFKINIYDISTGQFIHTLSSGDDAEVTDGHSQRVFAAEYHPLNLNELISGGWDCTVHFWDDRQIRSLRNIFGPFICGEGLSIHETGDKIVTGSWRNDDAIEVWDYKSGDKITDVRPDSVKSLLYCCKWMGNKYLITGGGNRNLMRVINYDYGLNHCLIRDFSNATYCLDWKSYNNTFTLAVCVYKTCYLARFAPL